MLFIIIAAIIMLWVLMSVLSPEEKDTRLSVQQIANEVIKTAILNGMESGKAYTITEIIKSVPECADLTNLRVSALMRQIVDSGAVVRTEDKRKAYFTKVG